MDQVHPRPAVEILAGILDSVPQSIFWKDAEGVFLGCNQPFARSAGFDDATQVVGKTDFEMPWAEYAEAYRADDREVLELNAPKAHIIESVKQHDGTTIVVDTTKVPLLDEEGDPYAVLGIFDDVTERKRTEEGLRDSEERHRTILRTAIDGYWLADIEGRLLEVNGSYCRMSGYSEQELLGMRIPDLDADQPADEVAACISETRDQGVARFESRHRRKDGSVFDVEISAQYRPADSGQIAMFIRDISERKQAREDVAYSLKDIANVLDTAPFQIWSFNGETYDYVNKNYLDFTGLEIEGPLTPETWTRYVHPDDLERAGAIWLAAWDSKTEHDNYFRLMRKDGEYRDFWCHATPIFDENGEFQRFQGYNIDITEQQVAERAARRYAERIDLLLGSIVEGIHGQDLDGRITFCNEASLGMLGQDSLDAVLGRNAHDMYHHTRGDGTPYDVRDCPISQAARMGDSAHADDEVFWRADGTSFPVEYWARPMLDDGKVVGSVVSFVDITERKRLADALRHRLIALTQPSDTTDGLAFSDLFNIEEIQSIQDAFSTATRVSSIITTPDGTPITRPSNFCRLCDKVIRGTEKGLANCIKSDSALGCVNSLGPIVQPCLSGGLWDAGASITAGGEHVANWLIGQVRNECQDDSKLLEYADEIGADRDEFAAALAEVPSMPLEQFERIAQALFAFATELSVVAYQNVQQARFITEREAIQKALQVSEEKYRSIAESISDVVWILDPQNFTFLYVSPSVQKLRGFTAGEVMAEPLDAAVVPESAQALRDLIARHLGAFVSGEEPLGRVHTVEIEQPCKDGSTVWTEVVASVHVNAKTGRPEVHGVTRNISARKRTEAYHAANLDVLEILGGPGSLEESIAHVLSALRTLTGCDAAGIRLQEGDDFPYFAQQGFSDDFLLTGDSLLEHGPNGEICRDEDGNAVLECTCGLVISGQAGSSTPMLTPRGSFWTNDSFSLLDLPADKDPRHNPHNLCVHQGYASIALIPIRGRNRTIGLIHLDDRRKGQFTSESIEMLEDIASRIGEALMRRQADDALAQAFSSIVEIVGRVAETRDPYTAGHQRRVAELAVRISEEMGMTAQQTDEIGVAALLHDIGKMSVPTEILSKPGKLSDIEFELIKCHSEAGYQIIGAAHMQGPIAEIVYQHHERCDGRGYPRGLGADDLLLASKVIAVSDVVEAMVSHRPYRPGLGVDVALAEIERGAGLQYDSDVSEACIRLFREEGFAFSEAESGGNAR